MKKYIIPLFISLCSLASAAQQTDTIKIKVHDHAMTLYASGAGSPAVILEAGLGASHKAWDSVQSKIAILTKVVSYDRPGYLNSDTCSSRRDALTVAKELREGLIKAGIKPPYVLAGWSMGGAFVRVFAGLYPKDVSGLVLVDPAPEESYARFNKEFPELMAEDAKYMQEILNSKTRIGEREEVQFYDSSMNQARSSDAQHTTPTYLLIAAGKAAGGQDRDPANPLNKIWIEELEKWAKKRPNLKYEIITNSGHHIARFQPDTVVHAVRHLVQQFQMKKLKQAATPYKKPVQLNDGIQTATLKEVGIDEKLIYAMTDSITNGNYTNVHSVLISRNNKLVYEQYWAGNDEVRMKGKVGFVPHHRDSLHDVRSITKSVTSAAIMIAHEQGKINSLNQRIFDFFPQYAKYDTGLKRQITIQHLLNMTAGLYWGEELSYNDSLKKGTVSDAYDFILRQQVVNTPGAKFVYSSSYPQLLAAILERATGMSLEKFTAKYIFHPLGITNYDWTVEKNGLTSAWAGLRMRSRDLLKFGMLYLNNGRWKGKQIIPAQLAEQSLKSQVSIPFADSSLSIGYSNQFWIYSEKINGRQVTYAQAQGNGGQIIVIDKQNDLVLVTTSGNYDQTAVKKSSWDLYFNFVSRAVIRKNKNKM